MNKDKLFDKIVGKTNFPKNQTEKFFEEMINIIIETLKKGEKVDLVGFGGFKVRVRKGRRGVNPRTKKEMKIKDVKVVKFKAGKRLKEAVR
ncbi:HU family DNA-binding protein [Patescibacteria group bacterium]|nr:HU family DNA-binding protein [Patescibacteria group bacterium]